jgi:hypothetical protein
MFSFAPLHPQFLLYLCFYKCNNSNNNTRDAHMALIEFQVRIIKSLWTSISNSESANQDIKSRSQTCPRASSSPQTASTRLDMSSSSPEAPAQVSKEDMRLLMLAAATERAAASKKVVAGVQNQVDQVSRIARTKGLGIIFLPIPLRT